MSEPVEFLTPIGSFAFKTSADAEDFAKRFEADAPSGRFVYGKLELEIPSGIAIVAEIGPRSEGPHLDLYPVKVDIYGKLRIGE